MPEKSLAVKSSASCKRGSSTCETPRLRVVACDVPSSASDSISEVVKTFSSAESPPTCPCAALRVVRNGTFR